MFAIEIYSVLKIFNLGIFTLLLVLLLFSFCIIDEIQLNCSFANAAISLRRQTET